MRHFITANRKKTFQRIFRYNSGCKRKLWAIFCLKFIFEKSKHREAGLKHKQGFSLILVFVNENSCLCICFTATGGHFVCACVNMGCWSATEAFSVNCLRSVPAFAGCFLDLNDVYWALRSTNMFFKVSRCYYDESEFIVAPLSPLRGQSSLS